MTDRPTTAAEFRATYEEMGGLVPPRVAARFERAGDQNEVLLAQERLRNLVMHPDCPDQNTVQLVLFGILHSKLSDAAKSHGLAARLADATWEQMQVMVDLAFLFTGMSAANRGPALLDDISAMEDNDR